MKSTLVLALAGVSLAALSSCSVNPDEANAVNELVHISTRVSTYDNGTGQSGDNTYEDLTAYLFVNNVFTDKKPVTNSDTLSLLVDKAKKNKVFFVANSAQFKELDSLKIGSSDLSVFSSAKTRTYTAEAGAKMFMVSSLDLSSTDSTWNVDLTRGVARLDVNPGTLGCSISAVRVKNTVAESLLLPGSLTKPAVTSYKKTWATPATTKLMGVFYLYEHTNLANCTVEIDAVYQGQTVVVHATLPTTIVRNTLYEVLVKGTLGKLECSINIKDWNVGSVIEAVPDNI